MARPTKEECQNLIDLLEAGRDGSGRLPLSTYDALWLFLRRVRSALPSTSAVIADQARKGKRSVIVCRGCGRPMAACECPDPAA